MDACGAACKQTRAKEFLLPAHPYSAPLTQAKSGNCSHMYMKQLAEAVALMEDGLRRASDGCTRSELINRCFLSSLYEAQLASHSAVSTADAAGRLNSEPGTVGGDTVIQAMRNLERATGLAAHLCEYEVLTYCAIGLAELQISRRDLAAASATFDSCVASCVAIVDAPLRASLLQRLLPKSMEVCNMQGRTADSFARLQLLNSVLALNGRSVAEECPICGEALTQERACLALGCGHSFHRDCCDCWLGRKMFMCGTFRAECPVCTQVDWSLQPTPAAARALEEFKVACGDVGSASGSNGGPAGRDIPTESGAAFSGGNSRSTSSGSGSTLQASGRAGSADSSRVESESSSSCSGSSSSGSGCSDESDGEGEHDGEDCAESEMRWKH
ncbi:E3 ubiquitin-protein ligase [Pleodorina starrii]|nr:E3 ubiquitin-protein ligase [Pleodorina starrii]